MIPPANTIQPSLGDDARCPRCTFGRSADKRCDVFGTPVASNTVCRTFRRAGASHTDSRKLEPVLARLRPGVIYVAEKHNSASGGVLIRASHEVTEIARAVGAPLPGDKLEESHSIQVMNIDAATTSARIEIYGSGLIVFATPDIRYGSSPHVDAWSGLTEIRRQMEIDGRIPLINGVNRHAMMSGMALDMGKGFRVYLVSTKKAPIKVPLVVDTFGTDHVTDPVFVSAQDAFSKSFWKSA